MRYTLSIDQVKSTEWDLNINEAHVFDLITKASSWAKAVIINNDVYYFLFRRVVCKELAILKLKEDTVYRHYKNLDKKGLIKYVKYDGKDCVKLTKKGMEWNSYEKPKEVDSDSVPSNSDSVPNKHSDSVPTHHNIYYKDYPNTTEESETSVSGSTDTSDLMEATKLANMLLEHIINWDATHRYAKNPPAINGWIKDIDRAMRLDGRTYEQLEFIIKYIFTQNTEKARFWAINIQSGKKLRLQFDTIKHQIINERKKNEQQRYIDNAQRNRAMVESLFD